MKYHIFCPEQENGAFDARKCHTCDKFLKVDGFPIFTMCACNTTPARASDFDAIHTAASVGLADCVKIIGKTE